MLKVCIVHTHLGSAPRGNQTTYARWQGILESLGHAVQSMPVWDGSACDLMIALHARRSHESIAAFRASHPTKPLVVAATGTDIYNDDPDKSLVHASFELATRIIVLQPLALAEIPSQLRGRGRVIYQSLPAQKACPCPPSASFDVAFLANSRAVKDPLTALRAAQLLAADSPLRILHMGSLMNSDLGAKLRAESQGVRAFQSLGSLPQVEALAQLARCQLALSTSRHEGGANVVTEALALGVPLIVSRIPGSLGLLGEDYPGSFQVGDAEALAQLLHRAALEPEFLQQLQAACAKRAHIADPQLELQSFQKLLNEL